MRKITKAQELIATSRIAKAQARVQAARPYAAEITNVLSAAADASALDHPLLVGRQNPRRAGVIVVTSDRGLCGAYNANVLRQAEELLALLRQENKDPQLYVVGRKGLNYYTFRRREIAAQWTGFSERPAYADAAAIAGPVVRAFCAGADEDEESRARYQPAGSEETVRLAGIDELHIVYTEFRTMLSQVTVARRLAPMEVEYGVPEAVRTLYEFEPDADELFKNLVPKYVGTRIYAALLEASASELASRQRAMKSATDNANDLIRDLTLQANQARQAQITQEISEIVGGANALAAAAGSED
ncbi:ATP synthase gamma chain [Gandjariella thermophila]|uniref:ATP synthase gamma chain n=2 Tax=Gandjariella thermophila TaxID=1931992 RepID=A0A4D4JA47_9PSEU|nr:ATP synthase gamma chain [Gandjariella thermophila]